MRPGLLILLLLSGMTSASHAEYIIYLKGGHFIVADECTFRPAQSAENDPEADDQPIEGTEDCTKGKPKGQLFWSTINGNRGEVSADDVYQVFGAQTAPPLKPSSTTMPLEDYLITNRGESFVNAKVMEKQGTEIHGLKRDELAKINRRGLIEIVPEHLAKSRSGEGLCPGEPAEFAISEAEVEKGRLVGVVTNLSKASWRPWIDVEVSVKGKRRGKFQIEDPVVHAPLPNVLEPDEHTSIDQPIPERFLKELEQLKNSEAGVRLCYRKVKTEGDKAANR